jgi:uncharacterized cofD-like protein
LTCQPAQPEPTPEAIAAIEEADMIVLGPGSLYTSIIPNLLVKGIPDAILRSPARKVYVCNVMTQKGETIDYTVADHVDAILKHAGLGRGASSTPANRFIEGIMVNVQAPVVDQKLAVAPVRYDPDRLRQLGIRPILRPLVGSEYPGHHDAHKLAEELMLWFFKKRPRRPSRGTKPPSVKVQEPKSKQPSPV